MTQPYVERDEGIDWVTSPQDVSAAFEKMRAVAEELASQWYDHFGDRFGLAVWNRRMSDADWQHEMTKPLT